MKAFTQVLLQCIAMIALAWLLAFIAFQLLVWYVEATMVQSMDGRPKLNSIQIGAEVRGLEVKDGHGAPFRVTHQRDLLR